MIKANKVWEVVLKGNVRRNRSLMGHLEWWGQLIRWVFKDDDIGQLYTLFRYTPAASTWKLQGSYTPCLEQR